MRGRAERGPDVHLLARGWGGAPRAGRPGGMTGHPARDRDAVPRAGPPALPGADAVLISDYGKGVVTPRLLARLLPELGRRGIPCAVDPKEEHFLSYDGVTIITPNVAAASQVAPRGRIGQLAHRPP